MRSQSHQLAQTILLLSALAMAQLASPAAQVLSDPQARSTHGVAPTQAKHFVFEGRPITEQEYRGLVKYNESVPDIQAQNWAAAEPKLREAIEIAPNLYQIHSNLAVVLARLGKVSEAKDEADKAAKLGPDKPEPLVARAAISQELGKLDEAAALYDEFLRKFPTHSMATYVRPLAQELRREAMKAKSVAASSDNSVDDYFPSATYDAVVKWKSDKFPLRVYIPTDQEAASVPGFKPEFAQALREGFADWQKATDGTIAFDFINDAKSADIECEFTADASRVQQPAEGGEARVMYDTLKGIRHVNIIVLTKHIESTHAPSYNLMRQVSLHEIGHSLGLVGHSPTPSDVMFCSMPADDALHGLSERDTRTLKHLYQTDIQLADHNHGESNPNSKAALNNEGIRLANAKEYSKAAQKFEAALKLDKTCEPCKRNLSATLNNLGIAAARDGNYQDAVGQFKRALELEGNSGDNQKRVSIMGNLALVYQKLGKSAEAAETLKNMRSIGGDAAAAGGSGH
jgi:tetratricopeptide (TPR) repeat protein